MQAFKKRIVSILPKNLSRLISTTKLIFKSPNLFKHLGKKYKHSGKPIYLISFPRAGSSWVGSILGSAVNARYLREPITTAFFYKKRQSASVFSKAKCEDWSTYSNLITDSLNTKLPKIDKVVAFPEQWYRPNQAKLTIIKEINPLIIRELLELGIKPIYLIRHPFSVAKSYKALGWDRKNQFETRFSEEEIKSILKIKPDLLERNYFYQIGFLQGFIERKVLSYKIHPVCYEEIVTTPIPEFTKLFEKCGLEMTIKSKAQIISSLSSTKRSKIGDFSLLRNQLSQSRVLVTKKEKANFSSTMDGYKDAFQGDTPLYNDNKYVEEQ